MRLKWTNWQDFQALTTNAFQQVDRRIASFILKCGFSWSPALSPTQPIILTSIGGKANVRSLIEIGFKLEDAKIPEPSPENGFDYTGYLSSAWEALGVKRSYLESVIKGEATSTTEVGEEQEMPK
jgi:hypothetical protein